MLRDLSPPAVGGTRTRRSGWLAVAAGVSLAAVYFALPTGGVAQTTVFVAAAFAGPALLGARLAREGLLRSRPWIYLLGGTGLYATATPFWGLMPLATGADLPFPSALDGVYFASYVVSAMFLVSVIHRRYRESEDALRAAAVALVDAGIFALAAIAILWPALIGPNLADPEIVGLTEAVAVGYPLLTAGLVGLVARLAISGRRRSPAQLLLLAWAGGELAGDVFYGYLSATGDFYYGHPVSVTWLVSYVALAALALHPRLLELVEGDGSVPLIGWRLWLPLGAVLLPVGMALLVHHGILDAVAGTAVVLIIARLRLLSGDLAEQRRLADELAAMTKRFEHQSLHDPLTGLANRSLFKDRLERAWAGHRRHGRGLVVLTIDLDGFKIVNDRHGHLAGDQLLAEVADRMSRCVRAGDTLARLGGDEFAIVLPEAGLVEAEQVAERVKRALEPPARTDGRHPVVGASIGIVEAVARHRDATDLLREADAALYAAKATGRGRHQIYAPGIERATHVALADVAPAEAVAWAHYMRALRAEIAERKLTGHISAHSRAPAAVHRTFEQVLAGIEQLPEDEPSATLVLPGERELEEFVFHQTAVQHWADALVARGDLTTRRTPAADRFWSRLEDQVAAS